MDPKLITKTASLAILEQLAGERRRILSDWRALILLRRATFATSPSQRRWLQMPQSLTDIWPILRRMEKKGELRALPKLRHVYEVIVPYARFGPLSEEEILMEVHPYAALSHLSALVFHHFTDELPKEIIASVSTDRPTGMLPPSTTSDDWVGLELVRGREVPRILGQPVRWTRLKPERYFGVREYHPFGFAIRVTDPERTLLDGLQDPLLSGGIENVLQAWVIARDTLDLDNLIRHVEHFDLAILRQRVGFLLEELGLDHPLLDRWQQGARRGGSSKLLASAPYSDRYSERWNLSLNAPVSVLAESRS